MTVIKIGSLGIDGKPPEATPAIYSASNTAVLGVGTTSGSFTVGVSSNEFVSVGGLQYRSSDSLYGWRQALLIRTGSDMRATSSWNVCSGNTWWGGATSTACWLGQDITNGGSYPVGIGYKTNGVSGTAVGIESATSSCLTSVSIGFKALGFFSAYRKGAFRGFEIAIGANCLPEGRDLPGGGVAIGHKAGFNLQETFPSPGDPETPTNFLAIGAEALLSQAGEYVDPNNKFWKLSALGRIHAVGYRAWAANQPWMYTPKSQYDSYGNNTVVGTALGYKAFENNTHVGNSLAFGASAGLQTVQFTTTEPYSKVYNDNSLLGSRIVEVGPLLIGKEADWVTRGKLDQTQPNLVIGSSQTILTGTPLVTGNLYLGPGTPSTIKTPYTNSTFIGYYSENTGSTTTIDKLITILDGTGKVKMVVNQNGAIGFPKAGSIDYGKSGDSCRSNGADGSLSWGGVLGGATGSFKLTSGGALKTITVDKGIITSIT